MTHTPTHPAGGAGALVSTIATWLEKQRRDVPGHGWEFAAALRAGGPDLYSLPEPEAEEEAVAWPDYKHIAEDQRETIVMLKAERADLRAKLDRMRQAMGKISAPTSPERLFGTHMTDEGRAQLAFAMIDNLQAIARQALAGEEKTGASDV